VSDALPMFPLNAVLFPGVSVPLTVFEDRYRALVHHLLRVEDPEERVFGSVGIREGYEIGDHGAQSLFRVGCRVQLTEVESNPDGTFDIVGVGLERIELERLETGGPFPVGHVVDRPEPPGFVPDHVLDRARATFTAYRAALADIRTDPYAGALPKDPTYLSWTLAAVAPLPLHERQSLLEAEDTATRLILVTDLLRAELRAMNVIPSLPATEVARTRWSPN
jgi:Lon protease-like protein